MYLPHLSSNPQSHTTYTESTPFSKRREPPLQLHAHTTGVGAKKSNTYMQRSSLMEESNVSHRSMTSLIGRMSSFFFFFIMGKGHGFWNSSFWRKSLIFQRFLNFGCSLWFERGKKDLWVKQRNIRIFNRVNPESRVNWV